MTGCESQALHRIVKDLTALLELPKDASGSLQNDIAGSLLEGVRDLLEVDNAYARFELPLSGQVIEGWWPQTPNPPSDLVKSSTTMIVEYDSLQTAFPPTHRTGIASVHAWIPGAHGVLAARSARNEFPDVLERFLLQAVVDQSTAALRRHDLLVNPGFLAGVARPTLVGRSKEMSLFHHWVQRALAGEGCVVVVEGPSGIGKSALINEVSLAAAARGAEVLGSQCFRTQAGRPFGAWHDIFKRAQELAELFRLSLRTQPVELRSTHASQSVCESMAQISAIARTNPIILVIEDIHWADAFSLELIRKLSHKAMQQGILIILTYCSDDLDRQHPLHTFLPLLTRESNAVSLVIKPLTISETKDLLDTSYPKISADIPDLPVTLHRRSGGNPLFLNEMMRSLVEERLVWRDADSTWRSQEFATAPVPSLLRRMVEVRVGRLGDDALGLLSTAAVIGMDVPFEFWASLTQLEPDALHTLLDDAESANLIHQDVDGDRFRFAQPIVREALVAAIPPTQRRHLHKTIAEALMAELIADPETIARHLVDAADDRAVTWIIRAGEHAELALEWPRAKQFYEQAIDALGNAEDSDTQGWLHLAIACLDNMHAVTALGNAISLARLAFDQRLAAWALALRGRLICEVGGLHEGLADWTAGLDRIEALSDADPRWNFRERVVCRGTDPGLLSGYLALAGRFNEARQWISRRPFFSLRMNYASLDLDAERESWCLACLAAFEGKPELAHSYFRDLHAQSKYYGPIDADFLMNFELWCVVVPFMLDDHHALERLAGTDIGASGTPACVQLMRLMNDGDWPQALNVAQDMLKYASSLQRILVQTLIGTIARERGNVDLTWRMVRAVWPVGPEESPGNQPILLSLPMLLVAASAALDEHGPDSAKPWLDAHERWTTWIGARLGLADGHRVRARYELMLGHQRRAEEFAQLSLDEAESPRQHVSLLKAHRMRGELATLDGDTDLANEHLSASLALAESCGLKYEYSLGLLALANLQSSISDSSAAEQSLSQAASLLKPYGKSRATFRLDDLLAKLESPNSGESANEAGLSDRELEVLRLLSAGLTNPEIADRLFISRFTVKRHVSSILSKLGVSTRAAAAHHAVEHQLT